MNKIDRSTREGMKFTIGYTITALILTYFFVIGVLAPGFLIVLIISSTVSVGTFCANLNREASQRIDALEKRIKELEGA